MFSVQEWTSILKLSTMWEFDEIRKIAIANLEELPIDVVETIVMARDYHITAWFIPSLNKYAKLDRPISVEDMDRLGLEYILKVVEARQGEMCKLSSFSASGNLVCRQCYNHPGEFSTEIDFMWKTDCTEALRSVFGYEVEGLQKTWSLNLTSDDPPVYITTETYSVMVESP
jgi:hypothetical protein